MNLCRRVSTISRKIVLKALNGSVNYDRWDHTAHSHSQRKNFNNNHWHIEVTKTRQGPYILYSYVVYFLDVSSIPVQSNQSKHPWPTNQLISPKIPSTNHQLQGAMSTHIRLSKHTNIMDQDFGGKNEPLLGIQPKKRGRLLAARVFDVFHSWSVYFCVMIL